MHTHKRHSSILIIITALLVIAGLIILAAPRTSTLQARYFPETGYLVRGPFLPFFDEHGGIATFGYPLTNAYTGSDGSLVQVFQRAQLQLTVHGVGLAPIGSALHLTAPAGDTAVDPAFLEFYQAHGGAAFLGMALNNAHQEDGLLVQDFERARLLVDQAGNVRLANLGSAYLMAFPPPENMEQAAFRLREVPTQPPAIQLHVSVEQPTVKQGGRQTIYLYVEDDLGHPVAGAQVLAILKYDNATAELALPDTDERGFSSAAFIVPPAEPGGRVLVRLHVLIGEVFQSTETSYFQWW